MKKIFLMAGLLNGAILLMGTGSLDAAKSPKEIYQTAGPGVVFILASQGGQMGSVGTGSIIRPDGLVITNAHIFVRPGSKRLKSDIAVFLKPKRISGNHKKDLNRRYQGRILAYDLPLDLALLQIVAVDQPLTTIEFADSNQVTIGDQVYAIGHPEQGGLWSLTTGVISAYRQDYGGVAGKNLFQTDASINRGNSGGPLLDVYGGIIGINSLIARKAADGLTITDVNYSIRSNVALSWLKQIGYRFDSRNPASLDTTSDAPTPAPSGETVAPPQPRPVQPQPSPPEALPAPEIEPAEEPVEPPVETPPPVKPSPPNAMADEKAAPEPPNDEQTAPSSPPVTPDPEASPPEDNSRGGKILTRKNPYRMNRLLRDMQEMEDMMDDMRRKIRRYQQNP